MSGGRMRELVIASGCALIVGAAAGCGAGTRTVTDVRSATATTTVTQTVTQTVTVRAPRARAARAAATTATSAAPPPAQPSNSLRVHDFSGNTLLVTVNGVIPATPGPTGFAATAGNRLVALELTLTDTGPGPITSNANTDATLMGTDGQTYTADYDTVSQCTSFNNGNYNLLDGASDNGCVVFQIPAGVSDQSVQFTLGNGTARFNKG